MTRIRVKQPIIVDEVFGEWPEEWTPPSLDEPEDAPWVRYRQQRDHTLNPGVYELESIANPVVEYEDGEGVGSWLVLKGTEIGSGDWTRFIDKGKIEVLG